LANGPKSVRQDIRRQERRLEKLGSLHLRIYNQNDINAAREAISGLIFSHNKRWSSDESMAVYLNHLLSECFSEGFLHLSTLESNGSPISWHLGFFHKCRFYYYKIAHDIKFSNYSPGKIHLKKLIEESINQGAYIFDFLRGNESYKYDWTKNEVILYQIKVETTGLCLWSKKNAYKVIEANRNIIKKIRKGLNR
jgi:CelD/BcsL family acetyltransferase involved in cellulose biosynthesis